MNTMEANNGRRLPVYLLLDCSGSMYGEPIEAVKMGVKALVSDLKADPQALETAHLAVITFGNDATQLAPLTELVSFQEPELNASGETKLGAALNELLKSLANEVRGSSPTCRGDWRPLVFLMTDGCPTDAWEEHAKALRGKANIIACAAGPCANTDTLKRITETVVQLATLEPDALKAFFKWVSASVTATARSVSQSPGPVQLPPPPGNLTIVP